MLYIKLRIQMTYHQEMVTSLDEHMVITDYQYNNMVELEIMPTHFRQCN